MNVESSVFVNVFYVVLLVMSCISYTIEKKKWSFGGEIGLKSDS